MSGLSRTPGKRVWVNPHRGFESRPFRHYGCNINNLQPTNRSCPQPCPHKKPAIAGFFVCLWQLLRTSLGMLAATLLCLVVGISDGDTLH